MRAKLLFLGVAGFYSCGQRPAPLPQVDVSRFGPAIRAQVEPAYAAARARPLDAAATGKLGMLLEAHRQDQSALLCYRRAHSLDPHAFRWLYLLGKSEAALGQSSAAISNLAEALRIDPGYAPARTALADALLAGARFDEAAREYETVLAAGPQTPAAHYGLGRVYAQRLQISDAIQEYRKAIALFPAYGPAHYGLASLLRKQGDSAAADLELRAYETNKSSLPPENDPLRREIAELNAGAMAHLRRAADLEQNGKIGEAIAEQEQALEIDPKLVQAHVNLISLYGKAGKLAQAETHYHAAVALDPQQADAHYNYGVLLFERGQNAAAGHAFRETLRINPHHAQARHNLGFLFEQQGEWTEALTQYELAASNQAAYPLAHFHAGRILASRKQYGPAIAHLLKSLTPEDERTPSYLYALAATYARAGDRVQALKFAARARSGAASLGQAALLASIDKDIERMGRP